MASIGDPAAALPATIGNYRIEREIGRGGMGAIYVGVHQLIGKRVAIKVLLSQVSQREDLTQRFFNEARAITAIRHPGIVEVYDFGIGEDGNAYLVMEYLEGESLAARMKARGRLRVPEAVAFARQIAIALAAAHRAGIIHRDLKPDNVFVVPDPEQGGEKIKLLDFGVAKLVDHGGIAGPATVTGAILGTPAYMSPEQCEGSRVVDQRSDLYSLGCTMFVMLAGRLPFIETGIGGLIGAHLHTPAPDLREHCAAASPELAAIVNRLLAKAPADRFQTADELAEVLRDPQLGVAVCPAPIPVTPVAVADGATVHTQVTPPMIEPITSQPPTPRRRWPLVIGGILLVAGAATTTALALHKPTEELPITTVEPVDKQDDPEPVDKPVEPPPRPDPVPQPTQSGLRLQLVRMAAERGDFVLAAAELERARKANPDLATRGEADTLKAELAPQAIAAAAKRIAKLRDAGKCTAAKDEARKTAATWGKSLSLDRAATPCKSDVLFDDPPTTGPIAATLDKDLPAQIEAAYAARRFKVAFDLCVKHPPDRAELYVPCMVSACQIRQPRMAVTWLRRRPPNARERAQIVNALNSCNVAGVRLHELARDIDAETKKKLGDRSPPRDGDL